MSSSSIFFQTVWASLVTAGHAAGDFLAEAFKAVAGFFVSGRALQLLQSGVQAVHGFAVRAFSPLASLLIPLLQRIAPGTTFLPETVALWISGGVVVLILLILVLLGQTHRRSRRLPRVTRRAEQAPENKIEFDVVEPGPAPVSVKTPEQPVAPPLAAPVKQPVQNHAGPAAIPEISLEPLSYYKPPEEKVSPAATENHPATTVPAAPAGLPDDVFLTSAPAPQQAETKQQREEPAAPVLHPLEELKKPAAEEPSAEEQEPAAPGIPQLTREEPATEPVAPVTAEEPAAPARQEPPAAEESNETAPAALLSQLLEEENALQHMRGAGTPPAAPVPPAAAPAVTPVFTGDIDLDPLLHDGVVADATTVEQLFRSSYRSSIPKLAISAKNLQDVPKEMRHNLKITVVALSPIELSIARDLAMRLEAPAFVGEALLVAKKMGYETYLTTYANITHNYKDVHIVETSSLRPPSAESGPTQGLISLN